MQTSLLCFAIRRLPNSCQPLALASVEQSRLYSIVADTIAKTSSRTIDDCETEKKLIKVAVIGVPNAGKSSFINQFIDRRVSEYYINLWHLDTYRFSMYFRFVRHRAKSTQRKVSPKQFATKMKLKWFCLTRPAWSPAKRWRNTIWAANSSVHVAIRFSMRTSSPSFTMCPIHTHETHCIRLCWRRWKSTVICRAFWCSTKLICSNRNASSSTWWTFWPKRRWCAKSDATYLGMARNVSSSKICSDRSNTKIKNRLVGHGSPRYSWCLRWVATACNMFGYVWKRAMSLF